jgi:transcriptional regulator GlxA family with amidase domain
MAAAHRLLVLAYPEGQVLDIAGPAQLFAAANRALGREAYEVLLVGPARGPVPTSAGFALHAGLGYAEVTPALLAGTGTVLATGGDKGLRAALAAGRITRILRDAAGVVPRIAAVCTGAFFLAEAGLLDGRRAATHWNAADRLRRFRPTVLVDGESLWLRDGPIWTSAGVTAGMDLALAMLEADHGRDLALTLARHHVILRVRPGGQRQYAAETAADACPEPRLARLAERIGAAPGADWRIDAMAEAGGLSPRSLTRLFRRHLGVSPADFVEQVRLDASRRLLLEGASPVEAVAREAGFGSLRRMDRTFARLLGTTPREFRARFRTQGASP